MQLRQLIEGVVDILSDKNVDQNLSAVIGAYLLAQKGHHTMMDCIPSHSPYKHVASAVDNLRWDCFVKDLCFADTLQGAQWSCGVLDLSRD